MVDDSWLGRAFFATENATHTATTQKGVVGASLFGSLSFPTALLSVCFSGARYLCCLAFESGVLYAGSIAG